jgi:hypothetical protein
VFSSGFTYVTEASFVFVLKARVFLLFMKTEKCVHITEYHFFRNIEVTYISLYAATLRFLNVSEA